MRIETIKADFIIAGSGAAGLHAAYHASRYGSVVLITKEERAASSSYQAQGGVAAVLKAPDTFGHHIQDTLNAGRNYCDPLAVDLLVREGAREIKNLIDLGMRFDKSGPDFELGLEGGHSERRILHTNGAATGKALVDFLNSKVENTAVKVIEHGYVFNLITDRATNTCHGADVFLYRENRLLRVESNRTILATGGYSGLFSRTTNPHTSTGDGLWLAYNCGAVLKDLEFVQFHPTAVHKENGSAFLISEAIRGEGARLYNSKGERFMLSHPQKELAPRDVVAKEIFRQISNSEENFVYLDIRHLNIATLENRFPDLLAKVKLQEIDYRSEAIPVSPAAHYCIGGIETDLDGQTSVGGLYACGEVAALGVHGANRLASNSLLECLVFSRRAAEHASGCNTPLIKKPLPDFVVQKKNQIKFQQLKSETAALLNLYAGIERDAGGLQEAYSRIKQLQKTAENDDEKEYYSIRLMGMMNIAECIILSALKRKESRGVHTRVDFPGPDENVKKANRFIQNKETEHFQKMQD